MLTVLKVIGFIWLVGGTIFYIWTLKDMDPLDKILKKYNLPAFIGGFSRYINTVLIGFPYFLYRILKAIIFEKEE